VATNLDDLVSANEHYYSGANQQMIIADNLYNQNFSLNIDLPENITVHRSSKATQIVDNLRDQIRVDEPVVIYRERGPKQKDQEHKALMEMWGQHIFTQISQAGMIDPLGQAPHDLILRGAACIKLIVREDSLDDKPAKVSKKAWEAEMSHKPHFIAKPVDPLNCYPSPSNELTYMIERQTRRVIDIRESYPHWNDPKAKKLGKNLADNPLREVSWVEYWTRDEYIVEVDGDRIIDKPNPYGIIPYVYRYSGLGRYNADGNPRHLAVGILHSIRGELEAEIEIKTAMRAAWQYHVFPRLLTTDDPSQVAQQFQKGPGAVIKHAPERPPQWLESPPPNQHMMEFLGSIEESIRRTIPAALMERQADAGIHQAMLIGQALKIISPVKKALNSMGTEVINKLSHLMSWFELSMSVQGPRQGDSARMIRAKDFTHHQFEVTFEATDPSEDDRRMLSALAVKREPGLISRSTYREKFLKGVIPNGEEEEEKIMAEQVIDQLVGSGIMVQEVMAQMQAQQQQDTQQQSVDGLAGQLSDRASGAADTVGGREQGLEAMMGGGEGGRVPVALENEGLANAGV
jgi:hypothetical protein